MLTGDLIRVNARGKTIKPSFVDPEKSRIQDRAESVLGIYQRAVAGSWTRAQITEAIGELVGDKTDHKLVKGMAKVLADRSEFANDAEIPAAGLRARLFAATADAPGRASAAAAYAELAAEYDTTTEQLKEMLYSDLREQQRILTLDVPDAQWLIHRYNVALVQSVLLRCLELKVRLLDPSPPRARQLFRTIKFHELMYRVLPVEGGYELVLDGPSSLLRLSTRYGISLAKWFPNLLLQECDWSLEGTVLWTKRNLRKSLQLDSGMGLRSHVRDTGAYMTRAEEWFQERFLALESDWDLSREGAPLDLGGQSVVVPDFTFRRGRRVAHLEIVGVWRRSWLANRMRLLKKHGPGNLILAVSTKLSGTQEDLAEFPGQVIYFKQIVPSKDVLAAVESCARTPRPARRPPAG